MKFITTTICSLMILFFCSAQETAIEIVQKTIFTIDTIETIYYKQEMLRTDPQNTNDTIFRYREMYFKRLITDSIVGVKGHWYMYGNDNKAVIYEDIFDGNRLIRINHNDNIIRIYDLNKYPEFKKTHFWSHNTLFGIQFEFRYMLNHPESYSIERLNDTIIDNRNCYQILILLANKTTLPGFATKLEESEGCISKTTYFIEKESCYPIRMKGELYTLDNPHEIIFIDQTYFDIKFNLQINEQEIFNTTIDSTSVYTITEMKPQ